MRIKLEWEVSKKDIIDHLDQIVFAAITIFVPVYLKLGGMKTTHVFMVFLLLLFTLYNISSKLVFIPGIAMLILAALVSQLHNGDFSRPLLIYAYYFFIIGVAAEIFPIIRKKLKEIIQSKQIFSIFSYLLDNTR
jgi:hypothetical protein